MAIRIKHLGEMGAPVFERDACGEQITEVEDGNVYWLHDEPPALYFNHKRCASSHDRLLQEIARERDTVLLSEHLEVFLAQLLGNTGKPEAMPVVDKDRLYKTRDY